MTSLENDNEGAGGAHSPKRKAPRVIAWASLLVVGLGAALGYVMYSRSADDLARAQGALELQVLASRLGAAAIQAEYGQFSEAQGIMSGVFDGIVNHGIKQGSLPENYARVLTTRDEIIVALAQAQPEVKDRLAELFFLLQLPVDTQLDSRYIIPATDSGFGMTPPYRQTEPTTSPLPAPIDQPLDSSVVPEPTLLPDTLRSG